jgi:hypothetical protein
MPSSEEQQLLNDVLRDADYAAFRAEVYETSLAEFNAGRQRPLTGVFLAVAAVVLVGVLIAFSLTTQKEPGADRQVVSSTISGNDHVSELFLVNSSPLSPAEVIRSVPDQSETIYTQVSSLAAIQSVYSNPTTLSPMRDTDLLALFLSDSLGFLRTAKGDSLYYFSAQRPRLE